MFNQDADGKSKLEHVKEMFLDSIEKKHLPFTTVLMVETVL